MISYIFSLSKPIAHHPRSCVLSTQPTVPSLIPAPPVTYGWPPCAPCTGLTLAATVTGWNKIWKKWLFKNNIVTLKNMIFVHKTISNKDLDFEHWRTNLFFGFFRSEISPGTGLNLCDAADAKPKPAAHHHRWASTGHQNQLVSGHKIHLQNRPKTWFYGLVDFINRWNFMNTDYFSINHDLHIGGFVKITVYFEKAFLGWFNSCPEKHHFVLVFESSTKINQKFNSHAKRFN